MPSWFLSTPAHFFEQPSDLRRIIVDAKEFVNYLVDAYSSPDLACKAVVFRAFSQLAVSSSSCCVVSRDGAPVRLPVVKPVIPVDERF